MYVADKHLGKTCSVLVGELSSTQAQKKRMFLSLNMPAVDSTAWVNGIALTNYYMALVLLPAPFLSFFDNRRFLRKKAGLQKFTEKNRKNDEKMDLSIARIDGNCYILLVKQNNNNFEVTT